MTISSLAFWIGVGLLALDLALFVRRARRHDRNLRRRLGVPR